MKNNQAQLCCKLTFKTMYYVPLWKAHCFTAEATSFLSVSTGSSHCCHGLGKGLTRVSPENHGVIYAGKAIRDHQIQSLTHHHLVNQTTALSAVSSGFSNASKDGDSITSLGLLQCLITLYVKKFLLMSTLSLPCPA